MCCSDQLNPPPKTDIHLDTRGKQIPSARKALEFMRAALGEFQAGAGHEVSHNSRNENFAGLRLGHDAGRGVHSYASNIPASDFDLAGMQTATEAVRAGISRHCGPRSIIMPRKVFIGGPSALRFPRKVSTATGGSPAMKRQP